MKKLTVPIFQQQQILSKTKDQELCVYYEQCEELQRMRTLILHGRPCLHLLRDKVLGSPAFSTAIFALKTRMQTRYFYWLYRPVA